MPEYSNYIEGLTAAGTLDGTEILGGSKSGNARRFTVGDVAALLLPQEYTFASNGGNFPTAAIAGKLYVATDDHGSPGDADYVPAGSWMLSKTAGANSFSGYYIK